MFRFVLLVVLVAATTAFVPPASRKVQTSNGLFMSTLQTKVEQEVGPLDWIAAFLFPLTATKEMDMSKVELNPPRFCKAATLSAFRSRKWAQQDAAAAFAAKYVPESWLKRQKYMSKLDARDVANLEDEVLSKIIFIRSSMLIPHLLHPLSPPHPMFTNRHKSFDRAR